MVGLKQELRSRTKSLILRSFTHVAFDLAYSLNRQFTHEIVIQQSIKDSIRHKASYIRQFYHTVPKDPHPNTSILF